MPPPRSSPRGIYSQTPIDMWRPGEETARGIYTPFQGTGEETATSAAPVTPSPWAHCAKATLPYDTAMVVSLRGDMDTLLVFASLFSAVVTAFVVDSYKGLSSTTSADTTAALVQLLLHSRDGDSISAAVTPSSLATHTSSVWINTLWFTSLVLSLNTVLGAILAKQWLTEYELVTCMTSTSPRGQVGLRQIKFDSFGKWKVTTIIEYLPVQLICALFLFFAGLVYLVWILNMAVAIVTTVAVAFSIFFFSATTLLPAFFPLCAYCSPQSWLVVVFTTWVRRVFSQWPASTLHPFNELWSDALLSELSRPAERTAHEIGALTWVDKILAPWETALVPSLYECVDGLPTSAAAKTICGFFKGRGFLAALTMEERESRVTQLYAEIKPEAYWRAYTTLQTEISTQTEFSQEDESTLIAVFTLLHLVLCQSKVSVNSDIPLPGLTQLAKVLSGKHFRLPLEVESQVSDTLAYLSTHKNLIMCDLYDTNADNPLFTATLDLSPNTPVYLSLLLLCARLSEKPWRMHGASNEKLFANLLEAINSAVQSNSVDGASVITHWMSLVLQDDFITRIADNDAVSHQDNGVLGALQVLALTFKRVHDSGVNLPKDILKQIDVMIVKICAPPVVFETISRVRYDGPHELWSHQNVSWWGRKLGYRKARGRFFQLLCDDCLLSMASPNPPESAQIDHLRMICKAAEVWEFGSFDDWILCIVPVFKKCCGMNESDLAAWFPGLESPKLLLTRLVKDIDNKISDGFVSLLERIQLFEDLLRFAIQELPKTSSDDPRLFITLVSTSLNLARHYPINTKAESTLMIEFDNLLAAATAFINLQSIEVDAHNSSIKHWLGRLGILKGNTDSPLLKGAAHAQTLLSAAREKTTIEGLEKIEIMSQLSPWESGSRRRRRRDDSLSSSGSSDY